MEFVLKNKIIFIIGLIGSYLSYLLGGFDGTTGTLFTFMIVDYATGFLLSALFKKSLKTVSGGLSSKVGFIGLFKKVLILVFIMIGYRLDLLLDVNYIRAGVCYAFIVNELISIIENVGLIGFPIPPIILNAIDILKSKDKQK